MKLKTIFYTAGLLLAMLTKANAQTAQHDSIHVHLVQNKNGTVKEIDTTVASSQHDQLHAWLLSQGFNVPATPPVPGIAGTKQMTYNIVTDDIEGDSSRKIVVREINDNDLPADVQEMKIIILPDAPDAPLPPLPPAPPVGPGKIIPPDAPLDEEDIQIIIINDSADQSDKTIILKGMPEIPAAPQTPDMKKVPESSGLNIFPNPSNGHITLSIDMPGKAETVVTVTDMNGKTIYSESLGETEEKTSKEIDLSKNEKGMYTIKVQKGGNVIAERIVIQ